MSILEEIFIPLAEKRKFAGRITHEDLLELLVWYGTANDWRKIFAHATSRDYRIRLYHAYIVSSAWRRKRDGAMERAKGICELCRINTFPFIREATQIHHLTYERIGDELDEDLQALCAKCHKIVHGREKPDGFFHMLLKSLTENEA